MRTGIDASKRGTSMRSGELKPEDAAEFAGSIRGQFIISQALVIAARVLDDPTLLPEDREPSNAADMLYLADNLFNIFQATERAATAAALRRAKKIRD